MHKGFIDYRNTKIPFVIDDFKLELFSQDDILDTFMQEYRTSKNFLLTGECILFGKSARKIILLVEDFSAYLFNLSCYIIHRFERAEAYDEICFRSQVLDSIFQYKYHYLDLCRAGSNLNSSENIVYAVPFDINTDKHTLTYKIGSTHILGMLEKFDNVGKTSITLSQSDIYECRQLVLLMERLSSFLTSCPRITFNHISLFNKGFPEATFYCKQVCDDAFLDFDIIFYQFSVDTYIPRILQHLAAENDTKITKSIPLGHLGEYNSPFTPQRFIEQVIAFEYLFEKLENKKAKDKKVHLKDELKFMIDEFPQIVDGTHHTSDSLADSIKELRRTITHGYEYFYTFAHDDEKKLLVIKLAKLIRCMSLRLMGFSNDEIKNYKI